jgi:predicted murein hydrolase (TIGR00659 family)
MHAIYSNPLFGLALSIVVYFVTTMLYAKRPHPLTTPLLVSVLIIIGLLVIFKIPYKDYYVGGAYLNTLIIPSTVALAIPLYETFDLMKHHWRSIVIGITAGAIVNTTLTALLAKLFGMDFFLAISLFPKSVTTAMAIGITDKMQGMATITLVVVVATGILTSVLGPVLIKVFKIKEAVAQGLALGGTGHAIGTGTAMKMGQIQGAMAGLAIGVTGIVYVIISPLIASLILS